MFEIPAYYVNESFEGAVIVNCSQGFFLNSKKRFCSPLCEEWEVFPHNVVVALQVFLSLFYIIHHTGTVLALIFSCYNYKIMWVLHASLYVWRESIIVRFKFPSVLLIYYLSPPLLLDINYFINVLGEDRLLCKWSDLVESLENSTPFCQVTGEGYTYTKSCILLHISLYYSIAYRHNVFHYPHYD